MDKEIRKSLEVLASSSIVGGGVKAALAHIDKLEKDLLFERSTNDFDAKRLRRLATLVGASTPESDETLLGCAGTVIGSICRQVEGLFKSNQKLRATLKEVSGCHEQHDTPKLCEGCLISIGEALAGKWKVECKSCGCVVEWQAESFFDASDKFPVGWTYDRVLEGPTCPDCKPV